MGLSRIASHYQSLVMAASGDRSLPKIDNYYESAAASVERSFLELANIANHYVSPAASVSYDRSVASVERRLDFIAHHYESCKISVERLYGYSTPVDPVFARFGLEPSTGTAARISATLRVREALDHLDESLSQGVALFVSVSAEHAEAQSVPPQMRTRAFNKTVAHYTELIDFQDRQLFVYGLLKEDLEKTYWESPYWREAESSLHSVNQMLHGRTLSTSEAPTHLGERLGENTDAASVAIAIMSLLLVLWMPYLYKFALRDPRQQPYKKNKKKAKPRQQHQQHQPPTTHKKIKKSKEKPPDKPKKYPQVRSNKKARKTNSYKTPTVDEMKRCKQRWMDRMHRVHMEARVQFKRIRQELDARNLERAQPKAKQTPSKVDAARAVPVCNPSLVGIGRKAGKSQFLIQVGAVEHLYKTSKPSTRRAKGRSVPYLPCVDLHGMTKAQALRELDEHLPHWIAAAMQGASPWVLPVKIVCGGGQQVLSGAVVDWIRENKQVAKAPKERVL